MYVCHSFVWGKKTLHFPSPIIQSLNVPHDTYIYCNISLIRRRISWTLGNKHKLSSSFAASKVAVFFFLSKVIKSAFGYSRHIKGNRQNGGSWAKKPKPDILTWETEPQEMCRAHIAGLTWVCTTQLSHRCFHPGLKSTECRNPVHYKSSFCILQLVRMLVRTV